DYYCCSYEGSNTHIL
nr:immunoglobulin light chain junction region [Macaca mulatta]